MIHRARIFSVCLTVFLLACAWFSYFGAYNLGNYWIFIVPFFVLIFWHINFLKIFFTLFLMIFSANLLVANQTPRLENKVLKGLRFIIITEPVVQEKSQIFLVRGKSKENIRIITNRYPEFFLGDELVLEGQLQLPNSKYQVLNKKDKVIAELFYPKKVEKVGISKNNFFVLRKRLINFRKVFEARVEKILPRPESSLLNGIILGDKNSLGEDLIKTLGIVGLSHIVALSGYNITIIIDFLKNVIRFKSKNLNFLVPLLAVFSFVLATGLSASVVRASIMGSVILLAKRLGRQSDSLNAILLTAVIMTVLNPYILLYDVGFQLSFAALLGIVYLAPFLAYKIKKQPGMVAKTLAATLAAQLLTLPLIAYYFGRISLVAPLVNILTLPLMPIIMAGGFLAVTISFVSLWLGRLLALLPWVLLNYFINISEIFSGWRISSIEFSFSDPLILLALYLIIIEFLYIIYKKTQNNEL